MRLPFRTSQTALGESRHIASRQLKSASRRLKQNEAYCKLYKDFIEEYEALGHMQRAPESPEPPTAYYLPHLGVLREDAITTKLRVVFNGSSKTSMGISLNDILYQGGKLQVDATDVITWLRQYRFVFGTDIVKMFRQIRGHHDDWNLQRILWINEDQQEIAFQLTTVEYGLNCSPWLSLRVLQQLAEDEGHRFPKAVLSIIKGRYVDDIYGGADTAEDLQEIATQLIGLCHAGGLSLQKWSSNHPEALQQLGLSTQSSTIQFEEAIIKVLGLCWHPESDTFTYTPKELTTQKFTKRTVLSEIAQIFDPLGFIAPVIVRAKILIQDLWRLKLNWDDQLPSEYIKRWTEFREELTQLNRISIPRWLQLSSETISTQIHGSADASTVAMGAVVYLRTENVNGDVFISIICAKTKVAPIKKMTIPRLELTAALLLTELVGFALSKLDLKSPKIQLWSDSAIALAWINRHPSRWKEFVYNRVVQIQQAVPNQTWRYVNGSENPADCASRGISPTQLTDHQLWWSGSEWLSKPPEYWPQSTETTPAEASTEEKPIVAHPVGVRVYALAQLLERYSTLSKVLQVSATINRAIDRFRRQPTPQSPVLTVQELEEVRLFWIKVTQKQYFGSMFQRLITGHQLPKNHPLTKHTPRLDINEVIRVGGRLKNLLLHADEIHPIILLQSSRFTTLVINESPQRTLHGGTQLTLAHTRQKYWIIGGRRTVRSFILRCAICARHRGRAAQQLMGQLPTTRASPSRPFSYVGIDYAGLFPILKWRPTSAQPSTVHVVVFVCFNTSAAHLELVNRQTSDAFIGAYKRFTGRRGIPQIIYSDNASTFVGASRILINLYNQQDQPENQQIRAVLAANGTQWKFIPPGSPHFGGKWEATVKATKYHMKRVLGTTTYTYEELNTILVQIAACLNSRPIAPMSDDPDDLQALTSGHFLIGEPLQIIPEQPINNDNPSRLTRWDWVTPKIQQFWTRWSRECLQRYLAIYKWKHQQENIKVGDMVLMVDDDRPPARWPLARVLEVRLGTDGLTRVARVRTARVEVATRQFGSPDPANINVTYSTFTRAIAKLCLLPSDPPPREIPPEIDEPRGNHQE